MDLIGHKKSLRKELRSIRRRLSIRVRRRHDTSMCTTLFSLPEFQQANTVFCYVGIFEHGETDTCTIIDRLHSTGRTVVAPFVVDKGDDEGSTPRMEARVIDPSTSLVSSDWDLLEPQGTDAIDPQRIDLSIVPSLGVALNGERIGKGKAFYDRYLQHLTTPRICLCYEDCIVDPFVSEAHDMRMHVIITERRLVRIV